MCFHCKGHHHNHMLSIVPATLQLWHMQVDILVNNAGGSRALAA